MVQVFECGVRAFHQRQARRAGLGDGETGMVTGLQRFGGALNLHVHAHTLVIDGVFVADAEGLVTFHPAPLLTDADVQRVVRNVRRRILRGRPRVGSICPARMRIRWRTSRWRWPG